MKKIKIENDSPMDKFLYYHLEPIIDFLINNGNALKHNYRWGSNREGYFCHLNFSIDFKLIRANFILPNTIILDELSSSLYFKKKRVV